MRAPADPVLGERLGLLLDPTALRDRLVSALPDCARLTPRYVRYKPRTSCLVQYDVMRLDGTRTLAHAWLFADGRAERTWRSPSFARLTRRAQRREPRLGRGAAAFLRGAGVLFEIFPVDSRLPALARAASGRSLRRVLGNQRADELAPGLREARVELVRFKPGRKALLRYAAESTAVYAKLHADGRAARIHALGKLVGGAGVPVAPALAHVEALGAALVAEAPGRRMPDLGDLEPDTLEEAAAAAASLHDVPPPADLPVRDEPARVHAAALTVTHLAPELAADAESLARDLVRELEALPERRTLIHGDYYDDQLLVAESGVTMLDLDEAALGDPSVDAGTFLAHLSLRRDGGERRELFLEACARRGIDAQDARLHEAAALLGLAVGPFRRLEPDWPERIARILDLAAQRFRELRPRDARLPKLSSLADRHEASTILSEALAHSVEVTSVAAARHKPGSRCTLRYRLGNGGRVFVKTYASDRGARVFETMSALCRYPELRVARPLAWLPEAGVLVVAAAPGAPSSPAFLRGDVALAHRTAEALYAVHSSGAELPRRRSLRSELSSLATRVEELSVRAPDLAERAVACLEAVLRAADGVDTWRSLPCHRDFYESQLLVSQEDGVTIVDLDDAAMSDPAVDVANFVGHLELLALRSRKRHDVVLGCADAFEARYRELDSDLDPLLVELLRGATLLRLAAIHASRSGGARIAPQLVAASEEALSVSSRRARVAPR